MCGRVTGGLEDLRDGDVLVASFHPELTGETTVHERFLELVAAAGRPALRAVGSCFDQTYAHLVSLATASVAAQVIANPSRPPSPKTRTTRWPPIISSRTCVNEPVRDWMSRARRRRRLLK